MLFAREGAHVVLADLNAPGGEASAEDASAAGPQCVFQRTDVSAEADIQALVARALSEFGRLDVMFNNAGIGGALGSLADIDGRGLGPHPGGLPARRLPRHQALDRADARAGRRRDRLHRLDRRHRRLSEPARLLRGQGRGGEPHPLGLDRVRRRQDPHQLASRPAASRPRSSAAARTSTRRPPTRRWSTPSRCRWPASRRTSPRRRCSSPATRRASSPATAWWSTAAPPPARSPARRAPARSARARSARSPGPRSRCSGEGSDQGRQEQRRAPLGGGRRGVRRAALQDHRRAPLGAGRKLAYRD